MLCMQARVCFLSAVAAVAVAAVASVASVAAAAAADGALGPLISLARTISSRPRATELRSSMAMRYTLPHVFTIVDPLPSCFFPRPGMNKVKIGYKRSGHFESRLTGRSVLTQRCPTLPYHTTNVVALRYTLKY